MTRFWTAESRDARISRGLLVRMTLPIAAIGALLLAAGVYGAWRVHRLHTRGTEILAVNVSSIRAAENLETAVREMQYRIQQFLLTGDHLHRDAVPELRGRCESALREIQRQATTRREQQLFERMQRGYERFAAEFEQAAAQDASAAIARTLRTLADETLPNKLLVYAQKYVDFNEQQMADSSARNQHTASQLVFGLLLLGTCGGVAGLLAGYGIARHVNRTIVQLSFPIRDVAGKLNEVVGPITVTATPGFKDLEAVLQNVSQRVAAVVERLQQSQREALRAEQLAAVGQLAAGLAHELRNPLTSMKVIAQAAERPGDLDDGDLAVLREEMARLEQSVETFLDFARPPRLDKRRTELASLVEQTLGLVSRHAQRRGIDLRCELPQTAALVEADVAQIRQLVLNLVMNAFDAVPNGGTVTLRVSCDSRRGGRSAGGSRHTASFAGPVARGLDRWARLDVVDSGCGLPAELGNRIFEPFVSTKETGIGLGLSICRRIVDAHAGRFDAADRPEGGAVFTVRLPLDDLEQESHADTADR